MVRDADASRGLDQRIAVGLSVLLQQLGVRLSDDQIERGRLRRKDRGHRLDDELETLSRVDQPERRDDLAVFDPELPLEADPSVRLDRRHAVLDDRGLFRDVVDVPQEPRGGVTHDHDDVAALRRVADRLQRPGLRSWRHGVQRDHHRLRQMLEEHREVIVVQTVMPLTVQAELVLDVDDVDARGVDRSRRITIGAPVLLADAPAHLRPVRPCGARLVDGDLDRADRGVRDLHGGEQIAGERGDAAAARHG